MNRGTNRGLTGPSLLFGLAAVWVLSLMSLLSGFTAWMGLKVGGFMTNLGFEWSREWDERSPGNLAALLVSSVLVIIALREVGCWGRRSLFLLGSLVVLFSAIPVLALWDIFWNPSLVFCGILFAWSLIALWIRPVSKS